MYTRLSRTRDCSSLRDMISPELRTAVLDGYRARVKNAYAMPTIDGNDSPRRADSFAPDAGESIIVGRADAGMPIKSARSRIFSRSGAHGRRSL